MFNNQTLYDRPMRVKMDSTAAKKPDIPLPCKCRLHSKKNSIKQ